MRPAPTVEELNLLVRFLLVWNAILTVALGFCYAELKGRIREVTENFVNAVRKALA